MKSALIADDDPQVCALLKVILEEAGYHPLTCVSGHAAVALAIEHRPDIAILDVNMPDLDSFAVCRAIRANPLGDGTAAQYNALHEPTVVTDTQGYTTTTQYNAVGDPLTVTDPLRNTTVYTTASSGLRLAMTDGNGHTTQYGYDAFGDTVAVTDALGRVSSMVYDTTISRLSSITDITDPKHQTTHFSYDNEDRPTVTTYQDGSTVTNYLDADGNVTETVDSAGTTLFHYDGDNRLVQQTYPDGTVVQYSYDAAGHMQSKSEPGLPLTSYSYDLAGNLITVTNSLWGPIVYHYDAANRLTSLGYPNGVTTAYQEDADNRMIALTETVTSTTLLADSFSYARPVGGTWGLRSAETRTDNGTAYTWSYGYDADARLISATVTSPYNRSYSYGYDAVGNMTNNNGTAQTYDAANQITASSGYTYTFDGDGNQTRAWGSVVPQWSYDAQNHTTSYLVPSVITGTYQTASSGLRALKTVVYNGTTTTGTFDGDMYRQTTPISGTLYYERDPNGRLLVLTNGVTVYHYGLDGHGSVTTLTDHTGALKNFYTYDPYGNSLYKIETASIANPWQYAGGYRDAESGLYLLGVRYYSPGLGRFLQQDPAGSGTNSQYAYAGSNPCNNSDPSGMVTCWHLVTPDEIKQHLQPLSDSHDYWSGQAEADNNTAEFLLFPIDPVADVFHAQAAVEQHTADQINSAWEFLTNILVTGGQGAYIGYYGVYRSPSQPDACLQGDSSYRSGQLPHEDPGSDIAEGYWEGLGDWQQAMP